MKHVMENGLKKIHTNQSGFMLAPLLYMLALGGIGAAVMFSGYSQVLRSNAEMTSVNAVRQQLNSAAQTLSASATLTSSNTILTVPPVYGFGSVTDTARLPSGYNSVTTAVTPTPTAGVVDPSVGIRQLDPWGKYYVYCKWDSAINVGTNPSIDVISAGPDGVLQTNCGHSAAQGDDRINKLSVAEAISRANVWQVASGTGTASFGTGSAVQVTASGALTATTLTTTGAIIGGTTIAATGTLSGANISTGGAVTATGTVTGGNISTGGTVTATGTVTGGSISTAGTLSAGATTITTLNASGSAVVLGSVAIGTGSASTRLDLGQTGGWIRGSGMYIEDHDGSLGRLARLSNYGEIFYISREGANLSGWQTNVFSVDLNTGATTISGALTLGTPLAIASGGTGANTDAGARTSLGLGSMAVQNSNLVTITGGAISGVTFSGTISGGTYTGSVPFSSINAYPGGTNFLRQDGTWQPASITGGSANYVPLWSGASTQTTSVMYQNGINIGIGTTGAATRLDVTGGIWTNTAGSGRNGFYDLAGGTIAAGSSLYSYGYICTGNASGACTGASGVVIGGANASAAVNITNSGTTFFNGGNVGIGTASPAQKLEVTGQVNANSTSGSGGYISAGNYGGTGSAAYFPQGLWSNGSSAWIYGTIYTNGAIADTSAGVIRDAGGGWVRTYGGTGWYNGTYGGGMYMQDTTWVRTYGGKYLYVSAGLDTGGPSGIGCGGGLGGGFTFRVCGSAYTTGDQYAANFYHASDRRLKKDIMAAQGLELVTQMQGVTYNWKKGNAPSAGVIAQDIEKIMPSAVSTKPDGFKAVNYDALLAPIIESIKELKAMFDKLGDKVAQLFTRVDAHDTELKVLREELKKLHGEFTSYKAAHP